MLRNVIWAHHLLRIANGDYSLEVIILIDDGTAWKCSTREVLKSILNHSYKVQGYRGEETKEILIQSVLEIRGDGGRIS